jgi:glycosyltransferase involved in cell wall biosynthesis
VATAVGGTPEVVEDGVTGRLAPPGDPAALAARIVEVLEGDARAMGGRGRERVLRHFTFAAQAERYVRLFDELTAARLLLAA